MSLDIRKLLQSFQLTEVPNIRKFSMPWSRRLWLYRHGFLSDKGIIYDINPDNIDSYLSDLHWSNTLSINGRSASRALRNKLVFQSIVAETHEDLLPTIYAASHGGKLITRDVWSNDISSIDDLVDRARQENIVVKPVGASSGEGVSIIESGSRRELREYLTAEEGPLMFTEYLTQAEYAAEINPASINTIRVLTMVDPETQEPFIGAVVHRFGTEVSGGVDNWSSGGLSVRMDIGSGELGEAVSSPKAKTGAFSRVNHHPDTGAQIAGVEVPHWEAIKSSVLDLAAEYSWLWQYVGWDVVVTDDEGSIKIIEGNRLSDVDLLQTHEPLLSDRRVYQFYDHHGVL